MPSAADRFTPTTPEELAEFVRENAVGAPQPLYPVGGGTALDYGYPAREPGVIVSTASLINLIDYPARDMTVTVQSGMTVARLAELLHAERQQLPIDVPNPEQATLGGILATNVSGSRRFGYGTLRDYVIGISAVDGQGRLFSAGGRVVKNVAGYDLCKLLVGSLGTLGIITQVTLKLRPIPESSRLLSIGLTSAERLEQALIRLQTSATRPAVLDLLNGQALQRLRERGHDLPPSEWTLLVGIEGTEPDVAWQMERSRDELKPFGPTFIEPLAARETAAMMDGAALANENESRGLTFRVNLRPSRLVEALQLATQADISVQAQAGNGILTGRLPETVTDAAAAEQQLQPLRGLARSCGGNMVIVRCPDDWKSQLPVFGEPEASWPLMRQVKSALDPHHVLNRGRFIDHQPASHS